MNAFQCFVFEHPAYQGVCDTGKVGGDDVPGGDYRRHRGYGTKRAQLKRTEEEKFLAEIKAIYRALTGADETREQAEAILAPEIKQAGESEEARNRYLEAKQQAVEQRLSNIDQLGVESEIALRLLHQQLGEMLEQEEEATIQMILGQLL